MLFGRDGELERIAVVLERARGGRGGALLLTGDAGIGKTALLETAMEQAAGMQIIDTTAVQSEARLPFAALGELAGPVLESLDELPEPQAEAVAAALALSDSEAATDRLALFVGFLGLLRGAADERGLLIVVDDAHWLDLPSAGCLAYAVRRFGDSRIALLAAARTGEGPLPLAEASIPVLELSGLERDAAVAFLRESSPDLGDRAVERTIELTLGNPLALIELPRTLTDEQRRGLAPVDPVPAPNGVIGAAYRHRIERLDPQARRALLVAATAFGRDSTEIVAACRELGIEDNAMARCEAEGLIEIGTDSLAFSHPLLRSTAYGTASFGQRREAHRALAGHADSDSRAWHLAAAALGTDPEAAAALDAAALRATRRGAHISAADALERAARLSEGAEGVPRLFGAGLAAALGGSFDRAAVLLESAAETDAVAIRSTARHLLAMVRLTGGVGTALDNYELLLAEAESRLDDDPALAAGLFADAGVAAVIAATPQLGLEVAQRAVAALPASAEPTVRCQAYSILGMCLALTGRAAEARGAFDRAAPLLPEIELLSSAPQSIALALRGRTCTGQVEVLYDEAQTLTAAVRASRSLGILPYLQQLSADAAYRLGRWDEADRESEAAATSSQLSGQLAPLVTALAVRARVLAGLGDEAAARAAAARAIETAERHGTRAAALWAQSALGFLELGQGDTSAAIAALERARELADEAMLEDPLIIPWEPDLAEAYARAGRPAEARAAAESLTARAERNGTSLALGLAARCEGLAGSRVEDLERAHELHRDCEQPFELARTLLALGSRLHRDRRRVEARERLREAQGIFDRLGATKWSERTQSELRAAGARKRRPAEDPDELTAQEIRVATAVAQGATNREVAAELYLSPKTIDFHLGHVYRKLGIHSRAELATLVAEGRLEP